MEQKGNFQRNIIVSVFGNVFLILLGIIVPRITIVSYGSDINGLLHTVTQIFVYLSLLEGGIGQAVKNLMYKPLAENDQQGISYAASIANNYYRRLTRYYAVGVVILSIVCPLVLKTNVDHLTVFLIIILEGIGGVVNFYFTAIYGYFLAAYGKSYVNQTTNIITSVIGYVVKIVLAINGVNIIFLQAAYCVLKIGLALFYRFYFRRYIPWLDLRAAPKEAKLPDRNYYVITEISWLAYSSTDMIVLSTFVSTVYSSIYAIYSLVFNCLNTVMNALYHGVNYYLSRSFHEDIEKYKRLHNAYTSVFFGGITALLCTAYVLLIPFIRLYTGGITDAEYVNTQLPVFFCLIQLLTWSRYVMGNLSGLAGYAKQASYVSIVEAAINIILSVMLVGRYGIVGVLIGSVAALPVKVVYLTWLCEHKIMKRSPFRYIGILMVNFALFAATVLCSRYFSPGISNYWEFIFYGVVVTLIYVCVSAVLNVAVNPDCIRILKEIMSRRSRKSLRLEKNRFDGIDRLKLLCAFLVVSIHATFSWDGGYFRAIAAVAVPIFFMISGFFYTDTENRGRQKAQIKKILLMIIGANLFYLLWHAALHLISHDLSAYLSEVLTLRALVEFLVFNESPFSIHLWYLGALLYVLLIAYGLKHNKLQCLYFLIPILLACGIVLGKYSPVIFGDYVYYLFSRNFLFDGLPFFLLGMLLRDKMPAIIEWVKNRHALIGVFLLLAMGLQMVEQYALSGYDIHGDVFIMTPFLSVGLFIWAATAPEKGNRGVLAELGAKKSAMVYILHMFFKDFVAMFIPAALTDTYYFVRPVVVFIVSVIAAAILDFARSSLRRKS